MLHFPGRHSTHYTTVIIPFSDMHIFLFSLLCSISGLSPSLAGLEGIILVCKNLPDVGGLKVLVVLTQTRGFAALLSPHRQAGLCIETCKTRNVLTSSLGSCSAFRKAPSRNQEYPTPANPATKGQGTKQMQVWKYSNIENSWFDLQCPECAKCRFWCTDQKYSAVGFGKTKLPPATTQIWMRHHI